MDKPVLKDSLLLFERFGKVKSRSMFGGFGIFVDETMFALVVNNSLHIRAHKASAEKYKAAGYTPYVYKKRGFPVVTKYFALPDEIWNNTDQILSIATEALEYAKSEKATHAEEKPSRLKDLPNLRLGTERMLKKAGIASVSDLKQVGAVGAYKAIQKSHPDTVNLELLWALEGALKGTHWSVITQERRAELMQALN
ncbi:TfoX/Sxy family DNA transformation protein [Vibrio sp. SCSIO 43137]|uniref:TfoX/Sxy family DNA transformation protein n=1 Tax=Vibrio sp. SCSIO 43137 TaxID=3021011 RepID=UPI0023079BAB|nr:TfoX/Sxy family DNA transformation protein [Vibrio sp. SCSIO 43137]WCE28559.1 TfoX/Sxy family DNA transformation protein [Vibrio sp. SCSIO 43137]